MLSVMGCSDNFVAFNVGDLLAPSGRSLADEVRPKSLLERSLHSCLLFGGELISTKELETGHCLNSKKEDAMIKSSRIRQAGSLQNFQENNDHKYLVRK